MPYDYTISKNKLYGGAAMKMQGWMLRWLINGLGVILIILLIPETYTGEGLFNYGMAASIWAVLIGSIFIGIANAIIRPLLVLLGLAPGLKPGLLNLGLVTIIFNALILLLTVGTIKGFELSGWLWWLLAVLGLSLISFLASFFIEDREFKWGH